MASKLDTSAIGKAQTAVHDKIEAFKKLLHDAPEEAGKQAHSYIDSLKGIVDGGVKTISEKAGEWSKMVSIGDADVKEGKELVDRLNKGVADLKKAAAGWAEAFKSAMAEWVF